MTVDGPVQRLRDLGIDLGTPAVPAGHYIGVRRYGQIVATASIPAKDGSRLRFLGLLGSDLTVEQGQESARGALINCLATVRAEVGSLDLVRQVIRITGYVASAPGFVDQHLVMNAASDLAGEVFGDAGRHVRAAIGVVALPKNCSVGVELTVQLHDDAAVSPT